MDHSDREVIESVLAGEIDSFELLIDRYQLYVTSIAARKVPVEQVPEVVHDVFVRAYQSLAGYQGKRPFKNWLASIAVHSCCDYWRASYGNREVPLSAMLPEGMDRLDAPMGLEPEDGRTSDAERLERKDLLDWLLAHLGPEDRMVLTLTYLEGHSVAEAAELMGWSSANVKVRSFRAKKKLRALLQDVALTGV